MLYCVMLLLLTPLLLVAWRMPGFLSSVLPTGKNKEEKIKRFLLVLFIGNFIAKLLWISKEGNESHKTIFILSLAAAVAIWFLYDYDLRKKEEEKREEIEAEYSTIVRKLTLYLGAGMSLSHAFEKTAGEGIQKADLNPIYREMQITCREIAHGISQSEGYIRFGKRTGSQRYIRLGTLLAQNLKKGNAELLSQLRKEVQSAQEEYTGKLRKNSEEMATKLLFPMILIMGMAMMLIMIPVFLSL